MEFVDSRQPGIVYESRSGNNINYWILYDVMMAGVRNVTIEFCAMNIE